MAHPLPAYLPKTRLLQAHHFRYAFYLATPLEVDKEGKVDEAGDKAFDHDDFEPAALPGLSVVKL